MQRVENRTRRDKRCIKWHIVDYAKKESEMATGSLAIRFYKVLGGLPGEIKCQLCNDIRSRIGEKCMCKKLITYLKSCNEIRADNISERKYKTDGFFGYRHEESDIGIECVGIKEKLLIECKVLKDKMEYEVRNGLFQLLENLLNENWSEGVLLVFDQRKKFNSLFRGKGSKEYWLLKRAQLQGCPDVIGKDISVMQVTPAKDASINISIALPN